MSLADLIQRKKTTTVSSSANANFANLAVFDSSTAEIEPKTAITATLALADKKQIEIIKPQTAGKVSRQPDTVSAYCESYGGHCSQMLPGNDCGDCEYLNNPRQAKEQTETIPATFEQTGPVTCPYWFQVCWAVEMYREQCTRNTACRVYKFLEVNS